MHMPNAPRTNTPIRAFWCAVGVILLHLPHLARAAAADPDPQAGIRLFREKIEPVLEAQCYSCHSAQAEKVKAMLYLDSRAGMLAGGETGPAVVPGDIGESLLIQAIRHEDGLEMPAKKPKLPDQTIADFESWV